LTYPFGPKEPFRVGIGAGEKYRFHGLIDDVRAFDRALTAEEISTFPVLETVGRIASIPPHSRTPGQQQKIRLAFINQFAPDEIRTQWSRTLAARKEWRTYYDSIPTVMVMKESAVPRGAFVLKRGAYDAPGEKVSPRTPEILPAL